MKEVIFYETASGQKPIDGFLESLSAKVAWVLNLVEELDRVPLSILKNLQKTDDLWEVRVIVGTNIFRLLGFFYGTNLLVSAHAFQKKTQKTPRQAIKLAEKRKHEYFERNGRKR